MAFRKKVITTEDVKPDQPSDIILRDGTLATSNTIIQSGVDALHGEYLDDLAFMVRLHYHNGGLLHFCEFLQVGIYLFYRDLAVYVYFALPK